MTDYKNKFKKTCFKASSLLLICIGIIIGCLLLSGIIYGLILSWTPVYLDFYNLGNSSDPNNLKLRSIIVTIIIALMTEFLSIIALFF